MQPGTGNSFTCPGMSMGWRWACVKPQWSASSTAPLGLRTFAPARQSVPFPARRLHVIEQSRAADWCCGECLRVNHSRSSRSSGSPWAASRIIRGFFWVTCGRWYDADAFCVPSRPDASSPMRQASAIRAYRRALYAYRAQKHCEVPESSGTRRLYSTSTLWQLFSTYRWYLRCLQAMLRLAVARPSSRLSPFRLGVVPPWLSSKSLWTSPQR